MEHVYRMDSQRAVKHDVDNKPTSWLLVSTRQQVGGRSVGRPPETEQAVSLCYMTTTWSEVRRWIQHADDKYRWEIKSIQYSTTLPPTLHKRKNVRTRINILNGRRALTTNDNNFKSIYVMKPSIFLVCQSPRYLQPLLTGFTRCASAAAADTSDLSLSTMLIYNRTDIHPAFTYFCIYRTLPVVNYLSTCIHSNIFLPCFVNKNQQNSDKMIRTGSV